MAGIFDTAVLRFMLRWDVAIMFVATSSAIWLVFCVACFHWATRIGRLVRERRRAR